MISSDVRLYSFYFLAIASALLFVVSIGTFFGPPSLPPMTKDDLLSLKMGARATRSAVLNSINAAILRIIPNRDCISVVDPDLLKQDSTALESVNLDGYLYKNNKKTSAQICPEVLVPFEHEEMWFMAWYDDGYLHFLAEEDLINLPIGQKVTRVVQRLYPGRKVRPSRPPGCVKSDAKLGRKHNSGAFLWWQVTHIVVEDSTATQLCNGGFFARLPSALEGVTLMRRLMMLGNPTEAEKIFDNLPEPLYKDDGSDYSFMIKAPGSRMMRTFSNGNWSEEIDFYGSFFAGKLSQCGLLHDCRPVPLRSAISDFPSVRTDSFFFNVMTDDDLSESWFCVHSGVFVALNGKSEMRWETPEFKENQEVFMCKKIPLLYSFVMAYRLTESLDGGQPSGTILDLDEEWPAFSRKTNFKVMLQSPREAPRPQSRIQIVIDHPAFKAAKMDQSETELYAQLGSAIGQTFMVKTKGSIAKHRLSWLTDAGLTLNVISSLHPLFSNLDNKDNSILAYNVPSDKTAGPFWVCLGDVSIAGEAGGVYCIRDEALNRELRCSSVVGQIAQDDPEDEERYIFVDIGNIVYEEWYADCPIAVKKEVLERVKRVLENSDDEYEESEYGHEEL